MTEIEQFLALVKTRPDLVLFAAVLYLELRWLPLLLEDIGWRRATAAKLGVTEAEAKAMRPAAPILSWVTRLFKRPPSGGPPPALVILLAALLLGVAGCVSDTDRHLLDTSVGVNMGHAADESLPREAREIALDNADVSAALRYSLTGDELPPATRERLERYAAALGLPLEHYPQAVDQEAPK